jgi:hypothetical protein
MRSLWFGAAVGAAAALASAQAVNYCERRSTASDFSSAAHFGKSVAVDGTRLVVGAPMADAAGLQSGAAYLFTRVGLDWNEQRLVGSDTAPHDAFGASVDVDGDTLVVGATDSLGYSGSAYVFVGGGGAPWAQQQKLTASVPQPNEIFGASVALDGDTLVVGSPFDGDFGARSGSATVFVRAAGQWSEQAKLQGIQPTANAWAGYALAIDGDTILVGSPTGSSAVTASVDVYVRNGTTWVGQTHLISPSTGLTLFGNAVAVDGDTALVSEPAANGFSGRVHAFLRTGSSWALQQVLVPAGVASGDWFGEFAIGLAGDEAAISSPFSDAAGTNSGATHHFVRNGTTWSEVATLRGSQTTADDQAGATAFDGTTIVVGAAGAGHSGAFDAGEVYAFAVTPAISTYCTGKLNSQGCVPHVNVCGRSSASASSGLLLTCHGVIDQTSGVLFYGYASQSTPFQQGTLCVRPPLRRTPVQLSIPVITNGPCRAVFQLDFNALTSTGSDPLLVPGANVYSQWWMRDPGSATTTGLSDAASFTVGM